MAPGSLGQFARSGHRGGALRSISLPRSSPRLLALLAQFSLPGDLAGAGDCRSFPPAIAVAESLDAMPRRYREPSAARFDEQLWRAPPSTVFFPLVSSGPEQPV